MDNQIQGEVIGSSVFAPSHLECASLDESLHAVTHAALRKVCIVIDGMVAVCSVQLGGCGIAITMKSESVGGVCRDIQSRVRIRTCRAERAPWPLQPPTCGTYANTRMSHIGAGFAESMKQIVGNALLPNVCKAN